MSDRASIGVDLGGTKITAGLVSAAGQIVARERRLLPPNQDGPEQDEAVLSEIAGCIKSILTQAGRDGMTAESIGVGIPALADGQPGQSSSRNCPNLPLLERCDLMAWLRDRLALPVGVANDANCFALGESWAGEGKGARDMVGLTLGTGLGCGVVLGGQLHEGCHGRCGEIWDAPMPGGGILEDGLRGADVAQLAGTESARAAAEAARAGHEPALAAWRVFGANLGLVLAWLERIIDPQLFVLGGSMAKAWDLFGPSVDACALTVPVVCSKLGEDAALLGAAHLRSFGK